MNQNYWNNGGGGPMGQNGGFQPPYDPLFHMTPPTDPGKGKATASLVLGILSIILLSLAGGIVGIVLASKSRTATRMVGLPPSGVATAGLICSIVGTVLSGITVLALACTALGL